MPIVEPIRAFSDNYIWLIKNPENNHAVVVDPGDARPVLKELEQQNLVLEAILITHKHADHIGGVQELKQATNATIYGPGKNLGNLIEIALIEGDEVQIDKTAINFKILELPGHTMEHIAYYNDDSLFCGDTLFVGGCGRVFEGTMQQMYTSLQKLANLDETLKVYCAHEYTQSNLKFAMTVDSNNENLAEFNDFVTKIRTNNQPSVPSSIKIEREINPFLRCEQQTIQSRVGQQYDKQLADPVETFAYLRNWKDNF